MKKHVLTILLAIPFGIQANSYINQVLGKDFNKTLTDIRTKGSTNEDGAYADLNHLENSLKTEQNKEWRKQTAGFLGCLWGLASFTIGAAPSDNEKALISALSEIEVCRAQINVARAVSDYKQRLDMAYRVFKVLAIAGIAAAIYNREAITENVTNLLPEYIKNISPNLKSYFASFFPQKAS